jgi:peptide/nickel transport system permease protein
VSAAETAVEENVPAPPPSTRSTSLIARAMRLWRTRIGAFLVLILVVVAVIGPFVAPHTPTEFIGVPESPPGGANGLLGTDYLGQDVFSRFLYGGREILVMAVVSTAIGLVVGVAIGLVAAYARNALDDVLMRAMDVIMAFPQIMLALVAVSLVGASAWLIIVPQFAPFGSGASPRKARAAMTLMEYVSRRLASTIIGPRTLGNSSPNRIRVRGRPIDSVAAMKSRSTTG